MRAPDEERDHAAHRDARDRRLHHAIEMREERGDLPLRAPSHHGALPGTAGAAVVRRGSAFGAFFSFLVYSKNFND